MGKGNGVRDRSDDADSVRGSSWAARHALSMLAGRTTDLALGVFVGGILAYGIVVTDRWWNLHGLLLLPGIRGPLGLAALGALCGLIVAVMLPSLAVLAAGISLLVAVLAPHVGVDVLFLGLLRSAPTTYILAGLLITVSLVRIATTKFKSDPAASPRV